MFDLILDFVFTFMFAARRWIRKKADKRMERCAFGYSEMIALGIGFALPFFQIPFPNSIVVTISSFAGFVIALSLILWGIMSKALFSLRWMMNFSFGGMLLVALVSSISNLLVTSTIPVLHDSYAALFVVILVWSLTWFIASFLADTSVQDVANKILAAFFTVIFSVAGLVGTAVTFISDIIPDELAMTIVVIAILSALISLFILTTVLISNAAISACHYWNRKHGVELESSDKE